MSSACLDASQWATIQRAINHPDAEQWAAHLEACSVCQTTIDRMHKKRGTWLQVVVILQNGQTPSDACEKTMEDVKREVPADAQVLAAHVKSAPPPPHIAAAKATTADAVRQSTGRTPPKVPSNPSPINLPSNTANNGPRPKKKTRQSPKPELLNESDGSFDFGSSSEVVDSRTASRVAFAEAKGVSRLLVIIALVTMAVAIASLPAIFQASEVAQTVARWKAEGRRPGHDFVIVGGFDSRTVPSPVWLWTGFSLAFVISAWFISCAFWSRKNPLAASIAGLAGFGCDMAFDVLAFTVGKCLPSFFPWLFIWLLGSGVICVLFVLAINKARDWRDLLEDAA